MKNKILFLIVGMFLISLASSQEIQSLPDGFQGEIKTLTQTCANSSYSNITRISSPFNSNFIIDDEIAMIKSGDNYAYNFSETNKVGTYVVYGKCDTNGVYDPWVYTFDIISFRLNDSISIGVYFVLLIVGLFILLLGMLTKLPLIALFGSLAIVTLGLFTFNNGIDIYRSWITEAFSLFLIGIGAMIGLESIREILDV